MRIAPLMILAFAATLGTSATAQNAHYTGPTESSARAARRARAPLMTVKELLATAHDDQRARLQGRIVSHIRGDHYWFEDETGRVELDIDDDAFPRGSRIDAQQRVELYGEVDRDHGRVEFEVDRITPL